MRNAEKSLPAEVRCTCRRIPESSRGLCLMPEDASAP